MHRYIDRLFSSILFFFVYVVHIIAYTGIPINRYFHFFQIGRTIDFQMMLCYNKNIKKH